jgi:catechol 2,3-dioxygenase-like lactoylglutathione lyase family enzyme
MTARGAAQKTSRNKISNMFKDSKSFSSFSVNDMNKAKEFYGETLGLGVTETQEGLELNLAGGNTVFIYPKPNHTAASFTVLNFPVNNIEEAVDELVDAGLRLEHYELPELKTDKRGIAKGPGMKIAWFKDPAGNILSVIEEA